MRWHCSSRLCFLACPEIWSGFWKHSVYWSFLLPLHLGVHTGSLPNSVGGCGFSPQGVGSACRPTVGDPLVKFCQWLVGQLPANVLCIVNKYHVPLMPLDILICLFPSIFRRPYPHPSHGSPALVLWVLLERNEFVQQHPTKLR